MKNKKAGVPIPIIILVVGTIALCVFSLIVFTDAQKKSSSALSLFRELRVMYNVQNDMNFTGENLDFVKGNLYPSFYEGITGTIKYYLNSPFQLYPTYYPVVNKINQEGDKLVIRGEDYQLKIPA